MKQIIALFLALAVTTPAVAGGRDHHYRNYNHHNSRHHGHGDKWVAPLIGGVILGAIINEASKPKEKEVIVVKQQKCDPITIIVQDQWGNVLEKRTEMRCTIY
jgi:hypothetical protein